MRFKPLGVLAATALLVSGTFMASTAEAATTYTTTVNGVKVSTTTKITTKAQLDAFYKSSKPKTLTIDKGTGKVVSVKSGLAITFPDVTPLISQDNVCTSSTSCMISGKVPYADQGFSGTGTKTGSWVYRKGFSTGSHRASGYYTLNGDSVCFGICPSPPNTQVLFGSGQTATGIKVSNLT